MKRRRLLLLGAFGSVALLNSRYLVARVRGVPLPTDFRQRAEDLNRLASTIQTPSDARRLVDFLADLFSNETPSAWIRSSIRNRVAQAEFSSVTNSEKAIPELCLAEAWNAFIDTISAPEDQQVTSAELHNLRDALLTTARLSWDHGSRNIWAVPSIYATLPDGRLAPGCRAVESIRVLWDLANQPGNVQAARDRQGKGLLLSDLFSASSQSTRPRVAPAGVSLGVRNPYPIELAQRKYIQVNGKKAFSDAVMAMLTKTLA